MPQRKISLSLKPDELRAFHLAISRELSLLGIPKTYPEKMRAFLLFELSEKLHGKTFLPASVTRISLSFSIASAVMLCSFHGLGIYETTIVNDLKNQIGKKV